MTDKEFDHWFEKILLQIVEEDKEILEALS
jgi:hypothetical protein